MVMLTPQQLALIAEVRASERTIDPLLHHRWSSEKMREAVIALASGLEVRVRAGLRAGKTTGFAAFYAAIARGVRELDSRTIYEQRDNAPRDVILLPAVKTPNVILLGVSSFKQSSESTLAHYLRMIGAHDHRVLHGPQGSIVDIRVRPDRTRSDDPDNWSRIMVFPIEGTPPTGIGATGCHADETPTQALWTQMRMRISAGQHLFLGMTDTPEDITRWEWIAEDYKHPDPWKIEFVLSVFENQALSASEKDLQRQKAARDPLGEARLYGHYVNLFGLNPWRPQAKLLQRWLDNCRDPIRAETLMMPVEIETDTGLKIEEGFGELFIWEEAIPGERYYVIADSSLGIDDGEHDPLGVHVVRRGFRTPKPAQVARYNGYCGGYALGNVCGQLGERYNDGLVDPDVTGGYGQPVLNGLARYVSGKYPHGYPHINRDQAIDKQGRPYSKRLGFSVTPGNKADLVESLREALLTDSIEFPSAATVRCFMEARVDGRGHFIKSRTLKYEDFHCGARACQLLFGRNQVESGNKRDRGIERIFEREGIRVPIIRPRRNGLSQYRWTRS